MRYRGDVEAAMHTRSMTRPATVARVAFAVFAAIGVAAIAACTDEDDPADEVQPDATNATPNIVNVDLLDPACSDRNWQAPTFAAPLTTFATATDHGHIFPTVPIVYKTHPPSSGPHRPAWAKWGLYTYLPPQRWLHNLEHGGIALLYHPCLPTDQIEAFVQWAKTYEPRDKHDYLWVMTPYPELPAAVAAVAWEWTMLAGALTPTSFAQFTEAHHRMGPEAVSMNGPYDINWVEK